MKERTLGQKLFAAARRGNVKITGEYWGSQLSYEGPGDYRVLHFRCGFGGMKIYRTSKLNVSSVKSCDTMDRLSEILKPENDFADGDPMNYIPRDIRPTPLIFKI